MDLIFDEGALEKLIYMRLQYHTFSFFEMSVTYTEAFI